MMAANFYNLVLPLRAGLVLRGVYFKKKFGLSYNDYAVSLAASYVVNFLLLSILGLVGVSILWRNYGIIAWPFVAIFLCIGMASISFFLFPSHPLLKKIKIDRIQKLIAGWNVLRKSKVDVVLLFIYTALILGCGVGLTVLSFRVFGHSISIADSLFLVAVGSLGLLVSITPAGLGVNELLLVISTSYIGISPALAVASALLGRIVSSIIILLFGFISNIYLARR